MWVAKKKLFGGTLLCTLLILNCAPSARAVCRNVPPALSRKVPLTARKSALSLPSASTAAAARIPAPPIPRLSAIRTNIGFHQERENTGVPATARPIFVSPNNKTTGEGIEHATLQNDHCGG